VRAITNFRALLSGLANFDESLAGWDTSRVTTMYEMFRTAKAYNQPLTLDASSVTSTSYSTQRESNPRSSDPHTWL
jgi:hypothetical protein